MTHAAKKSRPAGHGPARGHPASIAHLDAGVAVVTVAVPEDRSGGLIGHTAWARQVRRFGRTAVWAVPAYAVTFALATWGATATPYLGRVSFIRLAVGLINGWLWLVALAALAAVLAGAPSRGAALTGLLTGLAAAAVLLPVSGVPGNARPGGIHPMVLVVAAASLQTVAWVAFGLAVKRSRLLSRVDGVLLIIAAPMIGVVGLFVDMLRVIGAVLLLAAGLGLVRTVARLGTAAPRTIANASGDVGGRRSAAG